MTGRAYTVAELRLILTNDPIENLVGLDPYEVDKFLKYLERRDTTLTHQPPQKPA